MIIDRHGAVVEGVRGAGLMQGLQCKVSNLDLVNKAREKGLLLIPAGDNVARILPPLIVEAEHISEGVGLIDAACAELAS